jgi:hypothetical protein
VTAVEQRRRAIVRAIDERIASEGEAAALAFE